MSQKTKIRHSSNCQITAETAAVALTDAGLNVPLTKRKEDAKQTLYLNRI
jgi:hypothetical protein